MRNQLLPDVASLGPIPPRRVESCSFLNAVTLEELRAVLAVEIRRAAWGPILLALRVPVDGYRRRGTGMAYMRCPFHSERTPSFRMHPHGWYNCFGCLEEGRDALDFLVRWSAKRVAELSVEEIVAFFRGPFHRGPVLVPPEQLRLPYPEPFFAETPAAAKACAPLDEGEPFILDEDERTA